MLEGAPVYSWWLIGNPKREMGWLMARDAKMDDALYDELLKKFENYNYTISAFKRIPQFKEQIGKPGFQ